MRSPPAFEFEVPSGEAARPEVRMLWEVGVQQPKSVHGTAEPARVTRREAKDGQAAGCHDMET